jgi:hypothetical protein
MPGICRQVFSGWFHTQQVIQGVNLVTKRLPGLVQVPCQFRNGQVLGPVPLISYHVAQGIQQGPVAAIYLLTGGPEAVEKGIRQVALQPVRAKSSSSTSRPRGLGFDCTGMAERN